MALSLVSIVPGHLSLVGGVKDFTDNNLLMIFVAMVQLYTLSYSVMATDSAWGRSSRKIKLYAGLDNQVQEEK